MASCVVAFDCNSMNEDLTKDGDLLIDCYSFRYWFLLFLVWELPEFHHMALYFIFLAGVFSLGKRDQGKLCGANLSYRLQKTV